MAKIGDSWQSRRELVREKKTYEGDVPQEPKWRRKLRTALTGLSEGPWRDLGYVRADPPNWESGHYQLAAEDDVGPREGTGEKPR